MQTQACPSGADISGSTLFAMPFAASGSFTDWSIFVTTALASRSNIGATF